LVGAPDRFREELTDLPPGVTFVTSLAAQLDLILFFVKSQSEMNS